MTSTTLVARWATRGGRYWMELHKVGDSYSYSTDNGGGHLGLRTLEAAIDEMESRANTLRAFDDINMKRVSI